MGSSKLNLAVAIGPEANSSNAEICVSTVTSKVSPRVRCRSSACAGLAKAGDRLHRAKELDERSECMGPCPAGALHPLEKKLWIGMPGVGPDSRKVALPRSEFHAAGLDHSACRLQAGTQEGVGHCPSGLVLSSRRDDRLASSIDNANGFSP